MTLIDCPECEEDVSENAEACPTCGTLLASRPSSLKQEVLGQWTRRAILLAFVFFFFGLLFSATRFEYFGGWVWLMVWLFSFIATIVAGAKILSIMSKSYLGREADVGLLFLLLPAGFILIWSFGFPLIPPLEYSSIVGKMSHLAMAVTMVVGPIFIAEHSSEKWIWALTFGYYACLGLAPFLFLFLPWWTDRLLPIIFGITFIISIVWFD